MRKLTWAIFLVGDDSWKIVHMATSTYDAAPRTDVHLATR